jgi:septal ring factor EnvC (AmiA/AmiB activator)
MAAHSLAGLGLALMLAAWNPIAAGEDEARASSPEKLRAMQAEISRLRSEVASLQSRERGVLGVVERLRAELRLKEAELREVDLRLGSTERNLGVATERLLGLEQAQGERRAYLGFRLREIYKRGPQQAVQRLLGGGAIANYLRGLEYAAYLSERDGRILSEYVADVAEAESASRALAAEKARLLILRGEAESTRAAVDSKRAAQASLLEGIKRDRDKRLQALAELEGAAMELQKIVERVGEDRGDSPLDVRKFRGLLDWPADGKISSGFGTAVHPRFRTSVPHPGVDIEAPEGAAFRAIFDGKVAFASWLHGYGLTTIVDHGNGIVSVYAHASVLLVEAGDAVGRGETLGKVGETGSLRGPYLYFEVREDGKAVDPVRWLRRR